MTYSTPAPRLYRSIEDNRLAGGGEMGNIALKVYLRFLAIGRSGNATVRISRGLDDRQSLDRPALPRRVPSLENDHDAGPGRLHP